MEFLELSYSSLGSAHWVGFCNVVIKPDGVFVAYNGIIELCFVLCYIAQQLFVSTLNSFLFDHNMAHKS